MPDSPRIIGLSASVRGEEVKVSELVVTSRVNELATVTLVGHSSADARATSGSAKITVDKFAAKVGALQNYVMNTSRREADMLVSLDDGNGGTITFNGFLSAPSFQISDRGAMMVYNGVHVAALLGFYDPSIYNALGFGQAYDQVRDSAFDPTTWTDVQGSIANRLVRLIERNEKVLHDLKTRVQSPSSEDFTFKLQTQTRNATILPQVLSFLRSSNATTSIPPLETASDAQKKKLRVFLQQALTSETNFLSVVVNVLREAFGLQFVCYLSGSPAARLELVRYANAAASTIVVPAQSVSWQGGGHFNLPLSSVVIMAAAQREAMKGSIAQDRIPSNFPIATAAFPSDALARPGARVERLAGPPWFESQGLPNPDTGRVRGSIEEYVARIPRYSELIKTNNAAQQRVLEWWAETKFTYLSLLNSRATARIPLDVNIQPGRVYEVRVSDAEGGTSSLFQAYVLSVSHRVSSQRGSLDASTDIEFSHVQANGYQQPGTRLAQVNL